MAKDQGDLAIFAERTTQSGWSTFPQADFWPGWLSELQFLDCS